MEHQYINLAQNIINNGCETVDRTGVGTKQLFAQQLKFDLFTSTSTDTHIRCKIPLLTTKAMATKSLIEEILWMLSGSTDSTQLTSSIWKHNTSHEFHTSLGLGSYPVGEIGPTYGHNFRHFGSSILHTQAGSFNVGLSKSDENFNKPITQPITNQRVGIDQIDNLIKSIKSNPSSRRLIISLWDPTTLDECVLPPCVYCYQFCVEHDKLSLLVSQRSADVALGLPFNIAQSTIILAMVAQETGYEVGTLTYSIGCAHIYNNHLNKMTEQIDREPFDPPTLCIAKKPFDTITPDDITIEDYIHHPRISFPLN